MAATKKASKAVQTDAVDGVALEPTDTGNAPQTDVEEILTLLEPVHVAITEETDTPEDDDMSVWVAPVRDESFVSTGEVPLTRKMTRRAQSNVMDLMYNGNTSQARTYWRKRLISEGVLSA